MREMEMIIKRRDFLKKCTSIGMGGLLLSNRTLALNTATRPPNIILIMVDDLGWADIGSYGQKVVPTPNLDRMASKGVRFTNAYSGCSLCAPSRSVLMTGLHMGHTPLRINLGGGGASIRAEDVTVAQRLKSLGYATGGFGKWGLGDVGTAGIPEKHGFDLFFGYYNQFHAHFYFPNYLYRNSKRVPLKGNEEFSWTTSKRQMPPMGALTEINPDTGKRRQFSHDLILQEMLQFIRDQKDNPFFCYGPWTLPHGRFHILAEDPAWAMFKDKPWEEDVKVMAAMNVMIDRGVGQVRALLEKLGLADNTVIIFMSDNGAPRNLEGILDCSGPLRGSKGTLYEGGLRVPLLICWPNRIRPGAVSDLPVYSADIAPTLMELAGSTMEGGDGLSLAPTLLGRDGQREHKYLYWESAYDAKGKFGQAVRWGKWKAIRNPNKPLELYDLHKDQGETTDVAAAHSDVVRQIETFMQEAHEPPPPQIQPDMAPHQRWL